MPAKKKPAAAKPTSPKTKQISRFWLTYPAKMIQRPIVWELGHKFPVITNVRQASVNDQVGIVSLEVTGKREDIKAAIKWLVKIGVSVEPVEMSVIES
jgi:ABC-type methionine transport system ATPase subunit